MACAVVLHSVLQFVLRSARQMSTLGIRLSGDLESRLSEESRLAGHPKLLLVRTAVEQFPAGRRRERLLARLAAAAAATQTDATALADEALPFDNESLAEGRDPAAEWPVPGRRMAGEHRQVVTAALRRGRIPDCQPEPRPRAASFGKMRPVLNRAGGLVERDAVANGRGPSAHERRLSRCGAVARYHRRPVAACARIRRSSSTNPVRSIAGVSARDPLTELSDDEMAPRRGKPARGSRA